MTDRRHIFALSLDSGNPADKLGRHPEYVARGMYDFIVWGFSEAVGRYSRACFKLCCALDYDGATGNKVYASGISRHLTSKEEYRQLLEGLVWLRANFAEVGIFTGWWAGCPKPEMSARYSEWWRHEFGPIIDAGANALWFDHAAGHKAPIEPVQHAAWMQSVKVGGEAFPYRKSGWSILTGSGGTEITERSAATPWMAALTTLRMMDPERRWRTPEDGEYHVLTEYNSFAGMEDAKIAAEIRSLEQRGFIVGAFAGTDPRYWRAPAPGTT